MHLHRLVIDGIGPFPDEHVIDLARLNAAGLFLLEGPTGAGKSTLIDAIVFAIYGKVAATDGSDDRLRSQHCAPERESVVDLVLETQSGVFRVRRTPAYERARHRGPGTTAQNSTVALWRLTAPERPEGGEFLSHRADEVGRTLERAIGLDRDQFVQTIVLPQGEFSRFLRAKPEDRTDLLQKVFGTASYERVQHTLEQLRARAKAEVMAAADEVRLRVAAFRAVAEPEGEDEAALTAAEAATGTGTDPDRGAALRDLVTAAAQDAVALARVRTAEYEVAATARRQADDAHDRGARTGHAFGRRRELRARLAGLEAAEPEHRAREARVDGARRARQVADAARGAVLAEERVEAARAAGAAAASGAPALLVRLEGLTDAGDLAQVLGVERDRLTGELAALERWVRVEADLPGRRLAVELAAGEQEQRHGRLAALGVELEERLPGEQAALAAAAGEVTSLAAGLTAARARAEAARIRAAAAHEAEGLGRELAGLDDAARAAAAGAAAAAGHAAERHRARIAGIAAELAAELVPGEPCAVCGAVAHPAPATRDEGHVGVEEVAAADAERDAATAELSRLQVERAAVGARWAAAQDAAGDPAAVAAHLAEAEEAVRAAEVATERSEVIAARRRELSQEALAFATERTAIELAIAAARARAEARTEEIAADEAGLAAATGGSVTVAARHEALGLEVASVSRWHTAVGEVVVAQDRAATRREELVATLDREGFETVAAATAATLDPGEVRLLDQLVREHFGAVVAVRSGLGEPQLTALPENEDVDLAALEAARTEAAAAELAAAQAADRARDRARTVGAASEAVVTAEKALAVTRAAAAPVIRMGNLAGAADADNTKRLTLGTYVLMRRFGDVVASANDRLAIMSAGRYALAHTEERENTRTRKQGLALKIVDNLTGELRDPRTLSGGETFYVSLCLALGLADVVTGEAGGIELGTLFIDEGFGSLDADALELVLRELGRLRDRGRMIGVVSHVDTLKSVISEQIQVRKRPDGTSTLTVVA